MFRRFAPSRAEQEKQTLTTERFQAAPLLTLFSKIRRSNFLFLNAAPAAHLHSELTEEEAAFGISN